MQRIRLSFLNVLMMFPDVARPEAECLPILGETMEEYNCFRIQAIIVSIKWTSDN